MVPSSRAPRIPGRWPGPLAEEVIPEGEESSEERAQQIDGPHCPEFKRSRTFGTLDGTATRCTRGRAFPVPAVHQHIR